MKVFPTPQSPTSISVTWKYDVGDEVPISATINEYGPDGNLLSSQSNLPSLQGVALFTGLKPSTTYRYQWCGAFTSDAGGAPNIICQDPSESVQGVTLAPAPPPPTNPTHSGPSGPTPSSGVVVKVRAMPFAKMVVHWGSIEGDVSAIVRLRNQIMNGDVPLPPRRTDSLVDKGPFEFSAEYAYKVYSYFNLDSSQPQIGVAVSNSVTYPAWLGLKQFLSSNFDPQKGIKRLLPNAHPFVSVREIMSAQ
jgi:hypothetical protein